MKLKKIAALLSVAGFAVPAFATNGLNLEGYGPVATGMGGASMAYDNGTAGLINNPATLGLMKSGTSRFDIAIGGLHPDVTASVTGAGTTQSGGNAYYMPAIGYVRKDGKLTWGIGMMSQGGMGTEFGRSSVLGAGVFNTASVFVPGPIGVEQRTELGIGRVMFPLTFDVSDSFRIGGTVDYLWGGMDMQMALDGQTFMGMFGNFGNPNKRATGFVNSNSLPVGAFDYAYLNFSEGQNKFSQQLTTNGFAANIGFTWQATPALAVGAVYHARTNLKDMTGTGSMCMTTVAAGCTAATTMNGTLKVINFQWPETFGVGLSYQASDKWQFVADYKKIGWSNVFQNMHMAFSTAAGAIDFGMNLNWQDQDVAQLGASYKMSDTVTLRAGASFANQMIVPGNLIPLFPAVATNHYTVGAGFALSKASSIDFSLAHAPDASVRNGPLTSSMSQTNWQLMFSNRF